MAGCYILILLCLFGTDSVNTETKDGQGDAIETYIQLKSTQGYLNSFAPGIPRLIIETQMRYCPETLRCTHTYPAYVYLTLNQTKGRCDNCTCEHNCTSSDSCCADLIMHNLTTNDLFPYSCQPTVLITNSSLEALGPVYMISECKYRGDADGYCGRPYYDRTGMKLSDITPVTVHTSVTEHVFKNKHCAFCNEQQSNSLLYNKLLVACHQYEIGYLLENDFLDLDTFVQKCPSHNIEFISKKKGLSCSGTGTRVSRCNVTGLWTQTKYDPHVELACHSYHLPYWFHPHHTRFKNIFCVLCNGLVPGENTTVRKGNTSLITFSDLIVTKTRRVMTTHKIPYGEACGGANMYRDKYENGCKMIHCALGRRLQKDECVIDPTVLLSSIIYVAHFRLTANTEYHYYDAIETSLRTDITKWASSNSDANVTLTPCETAVRVDIDQDYLVRSMEARVQLLVPETRHPDQVVDRIQSLTNNEFIVDLGGVELLTLKADIVFIHSPLLSIKWSNTCNVQVDINNLVDVFSVVSCPMIDIHNDTIPWRTDDDGLTFIRSGISLPWTHIQLKRPFRELEGFDDVNVDADVIMLCIATYEQLREDMIQALNVACNMSDVNYLTLLAVLLLPVLCGLMDN